MDNHSITEQLGEMIRAVRDRADAAEDADDRVLLEEVQAELYQAHYLMLKIDARANRSAEIRRTIAKHFGA